MIADLSSIVIDANAACERVFGYARKEIIGRVGAELYADTASACSVRDDFVAEIGTVTSRALWLAFRRIDGSVFNARSTLVAIKNADGLASGYAVLIQTLPTEVEDFADSDLSLGDLYSELRIQTNRYRNTPAMLHSIDQSGRIRHISQAWLTRFGYREEEVIGRPLGEFLTDKSREDATRMLPEFWRTGRCDRVPYTFLTKSGVPVEIELSAIIDTTAGLSMTLAILEDVTERNRATRRLSDQADELRNFARVAAHDLQAPLRHISVFSKLLEDDLDKFEYANAHENALQIQQSASRLRGMVQGLLEFSLSTDKRLSIESADLGLLVQNAIEAAHDEVSRSGAHVSVGALPTIGCDPVLIERVFANVIDNAIKYVAPDIAPDIRIDTEIRDGASCIRISDNGIGIAREFQDRIFDPLKRLHGEDSVYPGFGIGLALCRKIVEAHHGRIWVEPNAAGGSTFFIQMPDLADEAEGDFDTELEKAVGDR